MFSDESRFSQSRDSRRVTIWRECGIRFEPRNIAERHHFPSRGVMVWAGIMMDGRIDLHFFDTGSMTARTYRDEALEPYVRLFRGAVGSDFIFMDDNVPCHRAVLIDDFLETENIQRMSWPANSPDSNPIEHVWDMLGRQIVVLSHPPSSVGELKRALQEAWNRLSPQLIHHLITSMIVRVHYFVRGGSVGHRSRASSKHLSPHLPVDELDSSGGSNRGCAAPADARVGVGSTKKAD
ncbi:transposable element Tc3 transposase [Trichonephila clavipes]|nr:transposable element Tc3 transposase [Trichonephila clavipes]